MSSEDYAAFHAFMVARRATIVSAIVADMAAEIEIMRSIPEADRARSIGGTIDVFLDALLERRPDMLDRLAAARVAVRAEQGLTSDHMFAGITIIRRHFARNAGLAIEERVPAAIAGLERLLTTCDELAFSMLKAFQGRLEAAQEALRRSAVQEELIRAQEASLRALSTPLIPVSDRVVVMPLVGSINRARADLILEALLAGVVEHQAAFAILDVTGVPEVDQTVAEAMVRAAGAVRLVGAEAVLTGIQPKVAQVLVGMGVDLGGIAARSTLRAGIAYALGGELVDRAVTARTR
jgi:anti-anti-sigma regulatory factor